MSIFRQIANLFSNKYNNAAKRSGSTNVELEIIPYADSPYHFGYKSSWFVIKTDETEELAKFIKGIKDELLLESIFRVPGWHVDISSCYKGWSFLICQLGGDSDGTCNLLKSFLVELSKVFTEAQCFETHRVVEYHCWAKAVNGELVRIYSYLGERGENICIEGVPTEAESKYNLENTFNDIVRDDDYYDTNNITMADESLVMEIAGNWSFDPTDISKEDFEKIWTNALTVKRVK